LNRFGQGPYGFSLLDVFTSRTGPYLGWPVDAVQTANQAGLGHCGNSFLLVILLLLSLPLSFSWPSLLVLSRPLPFSHLFSFSTFLFHSQGAGVSFTGALQENLNNLQNSNVTNSFNGWVSRWQFAQVGSSFSLSSSHFLSCQILSITSFPCRITLSLSLTLSMPRNLSKLL
jgi:hypothetical protein